MLPVKPLGGGGGDAPTDANLFGYNPYHYDPASAAYWDTYYVRSCTHTVVTDFGSRILSITHKLLLLFPRVLAGMERR